MCLTCTGSTTRASTHRDGSSGLGLSVARQLAWLLGGDIAIGVSVLGKGSTLATALPARYVVGAPLVRIAVAETFADR